MIQVEKTNQTVQNCSCHGTFLGFLQVMKWQKDNQEVQNCAKSYMISAHFSKLLLTLRDLKGIS